MACEGVSIALKVDRVWQVAQDLADELVRVARAMQYPREFLVRPGRRTQGHALSIRPSP